MKTAKRIVLCTLAMIMLASFYCVGSHAYILGGDTFRDENGNSRFSISVSNANNQMLRYTAYAELQKASGADYTFGACFASIYGWDEDAQEHVEYEGQNVMDYYNSDNTIWEMDVAYFSGSAVNSCEHSISISKRATFTPLSGKGYAIVGYLHDDGDDSDHVLILDEWDNFSAHQRKYFTPERVEQVEYAWVTGDDGFIQMSN